jgi:hypothetical protein
MQEGKESGEGRWVVILNYKKYILNFIVIERGRLCQVLGARPLKNPVNYIACSRIQHAPSEGLWVN